MLRPGGRLLYSTCTFAPEENEQVLLHLLRSHPEMELIDLPPIAGLAPARPDWTGEDEAARRLAIEKGGRLWPHRLRGEGHFVALLRKREDAPAPASPAPEPPGRPSRKGARAARQGEPARQEDTPREAIAAFDRFCREFLTNRPAPGPLHLHGEWLYAWPPDMPDLSGLHVLRAGLQLGEVRKGRFEPAHALALALRPGDARQRHDLPATSDAVMAYLRGEALPAAGQQGWTLVTVDGFPLGWAKAADGLLKNHYPKGLRWLSAGAAEPAE
jgi:NOL1/NOP2/fmu family ribosome biogenesis protein